MKKMLFAPVRAGILLSTALLLWSFSPKDTFFERIFDSIKTKLQLQLQSVVHSSNQKIDNTIAFNFSPGVTCTNLAADAIGGTVWEDINFDGDISTETTVYGVSNIEITIFNSLNEKIGTMTTDTDGNYLFSNLLDLQYRLEFTIPVGMQSYTKGSVAGENSQTTVQFVEAGNCANLGVGNPGQYCDTNPYLITPCFLSGEPSGNGSAAIGDVLVSYPSAAGATKTDVNMLAINREMGSTWGIAYAKSSQDIYAAAMMKRHAGFGPLGIGGIYRVNHADPANAVVEEWLDLAAEGIDVGSNPRTYDLPASSDISSHDPAAFDAVGKIGLGDIDISEDEKTLYVLNLNNNGAIIAIDIKSKTVIQNIPIENPTIGCGSPEDVRGVILFCA